MVPKVFEPLNFYCMLSFADSLLEAKFLLKKKKKKIVTVYPVIPTRSQMPLLNV